MLLVIGYRAWSSLYLISHHCIKFAELQNMLSYVTCFNTCIAVQNVRDSMCWVMDMWWSFGKVCCGIFCILGAGAMSEHIKVLYWLDCEALCRVLLIELCRVHPVDSTLPYPRPLSGHKWTEYEWRAANYTDQTPTLTAVFLCCSTGSTPPNKSGNKSKVSIVDRWVVGGLCRGVLDGHAVWAPAEVAPPPVFPNWA